MGRLTAASDATLRDLRIAAPLKEVGFDFRNLFGLPLRDLRIAAPLKGDGIGVLRRGHWALRDLRIAAPLKARSRAMGPRITATSPRSSDRGPVEGAF